MVDNPARVIYNKHENRPCAAADWGGSLPEKGETPGRAGRIAGFRQRIVPSSKTGGERPGERAPFFLPLGVTKDHETEARQPACSLRRGSPHIKKGGKA